MNKRDAGLAVAFAFGVVLLLAAALPASALLCGACTCTSSCSLACRNGPLIPDCPECNMSTCGESGLCVENCVEGGTCAAISCTSTINGTSGGDTLNGNSNHECINGLDGNDTISGDAGDDTIHGGNGNDTIYGGSGNDCLYGDGGSDNLTGDSGADLCEGETEASCEY